MKYREFAVRSGARLRVSEIGLGTAPLGDLYEKLPEAAALDTIEGAFAGGVTLFDTSPHYGNGLAELRCGAVLRRHPRDSWVLSTKIGRWMNPFETVAAVSGEVYSPGFAGGIPHRAHFDYSRNGVMKSIEQSLLRMGTDRIDILLIHDVDVWTHGKDFETRFREAMDGAYPTLDRLRKEGTVKAIGVGVNEADVCERFARAGDFDVMLMAGQYSLLVQPALASFLPLAVEKRIGIMLGGVFNSGILATGAVPGAKFNYKDAPPDVMGKVGKIEAICARHGVPLRRAAVRFALSHPAVISLVLGGVRPQEVRDNIADAEQPVPAQMWSELKREGLLDAQAPTPTSD
ncbi:MAG: aldo/keto reductase [Methylobacteriaceae bacterium]|nr:aldo/keto reductase [Methylobacteriaceae bacterium]MBV9702564.1 aldo/keto reductase [Methylobacteriaceae bacterium]